MKKQMSPAATIVEFMNRIYYGGMTTTSGGNLSIIEPDGSVWISPSGVDKGTLTEEDIMCVKADGTIIGKHRPSVEYPFHRAIYTMRPDIKAIMHAHPPALVSFSIANRIPDTMVTAELFETCGKIGFADYAVPGSALLGEKIAASFQGGNSMVMMQNHGVVLGADSMLEAFKKFEMLDFCARMIYRAMLIGTPKPLTAAQIKPSAPVTRDSFTPSAAETYETERAELVTFTHRCYGQKLFSCGQGTIAQRCGDNAFLITAADCDRVAMKPGDFVLVKGGKIESGKAVSHDIELVESVFAANPAINVVYLAAPFNIMAYAISDAKFDPRVIPESYLVLRDAPAFAPLDRAAAAKTISERNPVVIVRNDCVITTGRKLLEGFDRLEVLEYSAHATVMAEKFGGMTPMNDAQVQEMIEAFHLIP